jgi:hypothetical protein
MKNIFLATWTLIILTNIACDSNSESKSANSAPAAAAGIKSSPIRHDIDLTKLTISHNNVDTETNYFINNFEFESNSPHETQTKERITIQNLIDLLGTADVSETNLSTWPGIKIYYGYDNGNNIRFSYQPVNLKIKGNSAAIDTYEIITTNANGVDFTKKNITPVNYDLVDANSSFESNYKMNVGIKENGSYRGYTTAKSDVYAATIPIQEFVKLIADNLDQLEQIFNLNRQKRSLTKMDFASASEPKEYYDLLKRVRDEISGDIAIYVRSGGVNLKVNNAYENIPRHKINLVPTIISVESPSSVKPFSGMAADMASLCPPNCPLLVYTIKE